MTTEIPLKECSAYGQIDQGGGGESEENYIYEHPQWLYTCKEFDLIHGTHIYSDIECSL